MTEEELLSMGFVKGELSLKYHLPRKRFISVFCAGTPNEVVYLCYKDSVDIVDDLVYVHNFDYDGILTRDKIDYLINYFERDWRMTKQEANKLIEHWFESVEIAEYEYMICASQSEPFWVEVKKAIDVIQGKV